MRKGTGDLARLGSAQISSGVETLVPGQVCKVFPAQHRVGTGWASLQMWWRSHHRRAGGSCPDRCWCECLPSEPLEMSPFSWLSCHGGLRYQAGCGAWGTPECEAAEGPGTLSPDVISPPLLHCLPSPPLSSISSSSFQRRHTQSISREGKRGEPTWLTHRKTHHTWERAGDRPMVVTGLSRSSNGCPGVLVLIPRSGEQACLIWVVHLITKVLMKEKAMWRQKQRDVWRCCWIHVGRKAQEPRNARIVALDAEKARSGILS